MILNKLLLLNDCTEFINTMKNKIYFNSSINIFKQYYLISPNMRDKYINTINNLLNNNDNLDNIIGLLDNYFQDEINYIEKKNTKGVINSNITTEEKITIINSLFKFSYLIYFKCTHCNIFEKKIIKQNILDFSDNTHYSYEVYEKMLKNKLLYSELCDKCNKKVERNIITLIYPKYIFIKFNKNNDNLVQPIIKINQYDYHLYSIENNNNEYIKNNINSKFTHLDINYALYIR